MLKSFNQGSTLPADFTQTYIKKNIGNCCVFFSDPSVCVSPEGGHFGALEHPEAPKGHAMDHKMPPGRDLGNFGGIPEKKVVPFWSTCLYFLCIC